MPQLIKETTPTSAYTKHDQLHKELIGTFFQEFLDAFFPEVHDSIDFHTIKPLSEEMYTNMLQGNTRRMDIVIETKLKGTNVAIIIHVEPQSYE